MGRKWLYKLKLDWSEVHHMPARVVELKEKYKAVSSTDMGLLKAMTSRLVVSDEATPEG